MAFFQIGSFYKTTKISKKKDEFFFDASNSKGKEKKKR